MMKRKGDGERKGAKAVRSPESKAAVLKACSCVVGVNTHDVPGGGVYRGYGVIVECEAGVDGTNSYLSTIITPAHLFQHSNSNPHLIKVDVCAWDDNLYTAQLLACDFHSNLAALKIQSDSQLQSATLRPLNDIVSICIDPHSLSSAYNPFQLRPHSDSFKVQHGTEIIIIGCSFSPPFSVNCETDTFCTSHRFRQDCKELYWVSNTAEKQPGVVINLSGEVIGIMFFRCAFFPSNFITRWWNNLKSKGILCRPWVGLEISNLAAADLNILERFRNAFSDIGTGAIVTKVGKDTPAYRSGIKLKDVIIKIDGQRVHSKMEFFERMWDNAGNSVSLTVLRASDGQQLDLSMSIEDTPQTHFHRWICPYVTFVPIVASKDEASDTCSND